MSVAVSAPVRDEGACTSKMGGQGAGYSRAIILASRILADVLSRVPRRVSLGLSGAWGLKMNQTLSLKGLVHVMFWVCLLFAVMYCYSF